MNYYQINVQCDKEIIKHIFAHQQKMDSNEVQDIFNKIVELEKERAKAFLLKHRTEGFIYYCDVLKTVFEIMKKEYGFKSITPLYCLTIDEDDVIGVYSR